MLCTAIMIVLSIVALMLLRWDNERAAVLYVRRYSVKQTMYLVTPRSIGITGYLMC